MESYKFSIFRVNAIDNRTDFGNLGIRIYRAKSLDNNNRLDKICIINYTLSVKLIIFNQLNCEFRRKKVNIFSKNF